MTFIKFSFIKLKAGCNSLKLIEMGKLDLFITVFISFLLFGRSFQPNKCLSIPTFHIQCGGTRCAASLPTNVVMETKQESQFAKSMKEMRQNPRPFIMIPIVAACVGYITNLVGVKMLFYPVRWTGIPLVRFPEQPFGWLGWQGIVVAKRFKMAQKMVDVTISQLLNVQDVFNRLDPRVMARLLEPTVRTSIISGWSPPFINRMFLRKASKAVLERADEVVDIQGLVVSGLTSTPSTLSDFFQDVARQELNFLINSGFTVGFLLGILQMLQWMFYPKNWTLPAGGAIVGYITNWIALKWIFEPLNPTRVGPFVLQGMFIKRQPQVSEDFSAYIASAVLNAQRVWEDVLNGDSCGLFTDILSSKVPLPRTHVVGVVDRLRATIGNGASSVLHPLHMYTDSALALKSTLEAKMKAMSSAEFEQVLHPIFQEDELTLIIAGAVLGAAAGVVQLWINHVLDKRKAKLEKKKEAEDGAAP